MFFSSSSSAATVFSAPIQAENLFFNNIWGLAVNVAWKRLMKLSQSYGGEPRSGFCAFWLLCVLAFLAAGIDFGI